MRESLSQREYESWQRYWVEEPWGPFRDNLHAALIAREVRRPQLKPNTPIPVDQFMVMSPNALAERARAQEEAKKASILAWFRRVARPRKKARVQHGDDRSSQTGGEARSPDGPVRPGAGQG